ncbi:site-specific DNA-methyltransferase, partial [Helicobacter bilis]
MFDFFNSFQSPQSVLQLPLSKELQGDFNQKN